MHAWEAAAPLVADTATIELSFTIDQEIAPALFELISHAPITLRVCAEGRERFAGTADDLRALSFDEPELAGEHPIERALRILTH